MTTLAPKLPYDHPYAPGYPGYGSQHVPSDPDARDYLSRVAAADGAGVEVGIANAIEQFILGCKADSTWDAIQASCILCGARTLSGALVPLKGTAPTPYNFVEADYSRSGTPGLKGDGTTKYLDTNRAQNADPQNDSHHSVYATDGGTNLHYKIGSSSAAGCFVSQRTTFSSGANRPSVYQNVAVGGVFSSTTLNGNAAGLYGASRSDATGFAYRLPGGSGTHTAASVTPGIDSNYVFAFNNAGALIGQFDGRLAFYSVGASLDLASLDTRVTNMVNGIKFHTLTGLVASDYDPATVAYIVASYEAGGVL